MVYEEIDVDEEMEEDEVDEIKAHWLSGAHWGTNSMIISYPIF